MEIDPKSKMTISDWSRRQIEKYEQLVVDYPFDYSLYFRSHLGSPEYVDALQAQKDAPEWCEAHFAAGTWLHNYDMDGTVEFRFKNEDQLMLFKLRWHK